MAKKDGDAVAEKAALMFGLAASTEPTLTASGMPVAKATAWSLETKAGGALPIRASASAVLVPLTEAFAIAASLVIRLPARSDACAVVARAPRTTLRGGRDVDGRRAGAAAGRL